MIIIQGNVCHTNLNGQAVVEWSNEFGSFPGSTAERKAPHKEGSSKDCYNKLLVLFFVIVEQLILPCK